jgi:hypothetical protein
MLHPQAIALKYLLHRSGRENLMNNLLNESMHALSLKIVSLIIVTETTEILTHAIVLWSGFSCDDKLRVLTALLLMSDHFDFLCLAMHIFKHLVVAMCTP